jgi:hypothetical protein
MSNMINSVTATNFGTIKPSQKQQALDTNYLNFTDPSNPNFSSFAQQYLPEIYEQEIERYGNRTLSGFLRMVGAEMPMSSDQVIWSEQNRLHIAYDNVEYVSANVIQFAVDNTAGISFVNNVISQGQTLVIMSPTTGKELKVYVQSATYPTTGNAQITVQPYTQADLTGTVNFTGATNLKIFVYGSEFKKGDCWTLV